MRGFVQVQRGELAATRLHGLSAAADSFYWRLLIGSDPYGRHRAEVPFLQANLLYGAAASKQVPKALLELIAAGIVRLYECDGQEWLQIIDYDERLSDHTIANRPDPDSPAPPAEENPIFRSEPIEGGAVVYQEILLDGKAVANAVASNVVPLKPVAKPVSDDVQEVFDHWAKLEEGTGGIKGAKLTDGRRKRITARLKEGYTVEQLKACVNGYLTDPFYLGTKQGSKTRYTGLDTIFQSGERVERGVAMAAKATRASDRFDQYDGVGE